MEEARTELRQAIQSANYALSVMLDKGPEFKQAIADLGQALSFLRSAEERMRE